MAGENVPATAGQQEEEQKSYTTVTYTLYVVDGHYDVSELPDEVGGKRVSWVTRETSEDGRTVECTGYYVVGKTEDEEE